MNNFITKPFAKMSTLQLSDYGGKQSIFTKSLLNSSNSLGNYGAQEATK